MKTIRSTAVFFPGEFDYLRKKNDTRQLKLALIYFERVLSVIPESTFTGDNYIPHFGKRAERVERFLDETTQLREAGLLTCINPVENSFPTDEKTKFYGFESVLSPEPPSWNVGQVLISSILSDLDDTTFRRLVDELNIEPFPLYTGQFEINWFHSLARLGRQNDVWTHPQPDGRYGMFSAMVSPQLGVATLLNHALMVAIRYGAVPVANSSHFDRLLRHKFERIASAPPVRQALEELQKQSRWRSDLLAHSVLDLLLPDFELESFDDVVELRTRLSEQLDDFRLQLGEASTQLQACNMSEMRAIADDITNNRIAPALMELEKKLRLSNDKFFQRVFKGLISAKSSIPLIGTVFVGLPLWLGVAVSAGATITEAAIETYFEKREAREGNGLSFLLGVRQ